MQVLSEKENVFKALERPVSISRNNTISVLFYYRPLKLKFEKEKKKPKPKPNQTKINPGEKTSVLLQALKGLLTQISFSAVAIKKKKKIIHRVFQNIQAVSAWGKKRKKKLHLETFPEMPPQSPLQIRLLGVS